MAFAGSLGAEIDLHDELTETSLSPTEYLFSESNSRFLVEIEPGHETAFQALMAEFTRRVGVVRPLDELLI